LHVHDLVDFVSQEAANAGKNAAKYVKEGRVASNKEIKINAVDGVRYTVPCTIRPDQMDDTVTVRFRVGKVFKNSAVTMYFGDEQVLKRKKQIMAPGEMEQVVIDKKKLAEYGDISDITIKIESV
ncbi:MAG: pyridine nucleotide-disulfide oxidoreductase, partial [Lachnospiraceae bacterium]|nr:pyridine nucleotide-disulfide oxidoreductase [Lachnospiraceae bacterium]